MFAPLALLLLSLAHAQEQQGPCHRALLDRDCDAPCDQVKAYATRHEGYLLHGDALVVRAQGTLSNALTVLYKQYCLAAHLNLALLWDTTELPELDQLLEPNLFNYREKIRIGVNSDRVLNLPLGYLLASSSSRLKALGPAVATAPPTTDAEHAACFWRHAICKTQLAADLHLGHQLQLPFSLKPFEAWHVVVPTPWFEYNQGTYLRDADVQQEHYCSEFRRAAPATRRALFVASNSFLVKQACARLVKPTKTGYVDLGLDGDATPVAVKTALLELLFMAHAEVLLHNHSVAGTLAAAIAKMECSGSSTVTCRAGTAAKSGLPADHPHKTKRPILQFPEEYPFVQQMWNALNATAKEKIRNLRWLQQLVWDWQNPPPHVCNTANFLLFRPGSSGIGSAVHTVAGGLGVALCNGQILYVVPGFWEDNHDWLSGASCPQQNASWLTCYFQPLTSCPLPSRYQKKYDELLPKPKQFHITFPVAPCGMCFRNSGPAGGDLPQKLRGLFPLPRPLPEASSPPAVGVLVRYILRPQPWFRAKISAFLKERAKEIQMARPWASLHVRYGDKFKEARLQPLETYMRLLETRRPDIRQVFVSTETSAVLKDLPQRYPKYQFYSMSYNRIEAGVPRGNGFEEFVASFANLVVAIQADAFVGSESSNWCRLLNEMQSSRQNGGQPYHSVDDPTWELCFPH